MGKALKKPLKSFFGLLGRLLVLLVLIGIGLTVYGLIEPKDDRGTMIAEDYAIIKENSRSVYIIRQSDGTVIIPSIVISYAVNNGYIAVKHTEVPEDESVKPDFTTFTYWLLNSKLGSLTGPIATEKEFNQITAKLGLSFNEWLGT